ncbi:MAG: PorV/PorQ family protein [bacterium]
MKTFIRRVSIVIVFIISSVNIFALGGGTSNADFLKIGVGGRPSAMGEAYTGVADDANGAFWNPAGLTAVDHMTVSLMYLIWFADTYYTTASAVIPMNAENTLGLSIYYLGVPAFDSTKNSSGFFSGLGEVPASYDLAITGSYARLLGDICAKDFTISNISLGVNLSLIKRAIMGVDLDSTMLVDIGFMANITDDLKLGLVVKGIGSATKGDQSPLSVNMGMSYNIAEIKDISILLAADLIKPLDTTNSSYNVWNSGIGVELVAYKIFALRAGYKFGHERETSRSSFTIGAGVDLSSFGSVDYAFMPDNVLGNTHRISLSVKFGDSRPLPTINYPWSYRETIKPVHKYIAKKPDKVNGLSINKYDECLFLYWNASLDDSVVGYNVYCLKSPSNEFVKLNTILLKENKMTIEKIQERSDYYFKVTAVNKEGIESDMSEECLGISD